MPFIIGKEYAQLFCTTIGISVFVYYVFMILQVTKRDPLTGLLNRQAFYADIADNPQEISALISIDMNGLKKINDIEGHAAGDLAITTIADCFIRAVKRKHFVYRVGGDEFVALLRQEDYENRYALLASMDEQYASATISAGEETIPVTVARAIEEYDLGLDFSFDDIFNRADKKMYEHKYSTR
jgi:diguanylate cyclase (GGDEF)-like protein